jgi:hypothetical protein
MPKRENSSSFLKPASLPASAACASGGGTPDLTSSQKGVLYWAVWGRVGGRACVCWEESGVVRR